jgi:RNA polymerase sigma factor for flagellar operon FliA
VVAELEQRHGAPPTPEEIAAALGTTIEEVDEVMHWRVASWASLEGGPSDGLGALFPIRAARIRSGAPSERGEALLVRAIGALPEPEKTVITLYYGEELLLKEIGEIPGVTESRVSQVHSRPCTGSTASCAGEPLP